MSVLDTPARLELIDRIDKIPRLKRFILSRIVFRKRSKKANAYQLVAVDLLFHNESEKRVMGEYLLEKADDIWRQVYNIR